MAPNRNETGVLHETVLHCLLCLPKHICCYTFSEFEKKVNLIFAFLIVSRFWGRSITLEQKTKYYGKDR